MSHLTIPQVLFSDSSSFENSILNLKAFLIDTPIDNYFPISGVNFEGKIPAEALELSEGCTTFPILYRPTNFEIITNPDIVSADTAIFPVERLHVTEQRFENARFIYLGAVEQIWILMGDSRSRVPNWYVIDAKQISLKYENLPIDTPPEGLFRPSEFFENLWVGISFSTNGYSIAAYGWATTEITDYTADYRYEFGADGSLNHFLTSNDGTVYRLNVSSQSWSIEGN